MKTIPFDIKLRKDIQSEENGYKGRYKVQTRNGKFVRIICWDKKDYSDFPIVALVMICPAIETSLLFCEEGKYYPINGNSDYDLCLVDTLEPKFKIGDNVRYKNCNRVYRIADILEYHYLVLQPDQSSRLILFEDDDHLEIASAKTAEDFKVGQVLKCLSTGHLWLNRDGDCVKSDGHTVSIGGTYEAASQEESDKFFKELDENGYIWNPEKRKVEKKEPELTDFEQGIRDIVTSALTVTSEDGSCSFTIAVNDEAAREIAAGINKLVTKKLFHECF